MKKSMILFVLFSVVFSMFVTAARAEDEEKPTVKAKAKTKEDSLLKNGEGVVDSQLQTLYDKWRNAAFEYGQANELAQNARKMRDAVKDHIPTRTIKERREQLKLITTDVDQAKKEIRDLEEAILQKEKAIQELQEQAAQNGKTGLTDLFEQAEVNKLREELVTKIQLLEFMEKDRTRTIFTLKHDWSDRIAASLDQLTIIDLLKEDIARLEKMETRMQAELGSPLKNDDLQDLLNYDVLVDEGDYGDEDADDEEFLTKPKEKDNKRTETLEAFYHRMLARALRRKVRYDRLSEQIRKLTETKAALVTAAKVTQIVAAVDDNTEAIDELGKTVKEGFEAMDEKMSELIKSVDKVANITPELTKLIKEAASMRTATKEQHDELIKTMKLIIKAIEAGKTEAAAKVLNRIVTPPSQPAAVPGPPVIGPPAPGPMAATPRGVPMQQTQYLPQQQQYYQPQYQQQYYGGGSCANGQCQQQFRGRRFFGR